MELVFAVKDIVVLIALFSNALMDVLNMVLVFLLLVSVIEVGWELIVH